MVNRILHNRRPTLVAVVLASAGSLAVILTAAGGAPRLVVFAAGALVFSLIAVAQRRPRRYAPPLGPASAAARSVSIAAPKASELVRRENGAAAA